MLQSIESYAESTHYDVESARSWPHEVKQMPGEPVCVKSTMRTRAKPSARLLLLDDDARQISDGLRHQFPLLNCQIVVGRSVSDVLRQVGSGIADVIVLGWTLSAGPGMEIYQQIRLLNPRIPVIMITHEGGADVAIGAMQCGAYDCLFKPLDLHQLRDVISEALDVAAQTGLAMGLTPSADDAKLDDSIVGNCQAMREVYKAIGRVTNQDVTVLITGESGTGKELVARAIYRHSHRSKGPFLALNCAAIPEHLLESELFGHEKGAFTGADRQRIGKFEQCHGGTIFLDEIGDMPQAIQAKMLRVLQEQSFQRVGGNEMIHTNVRLIAATHHDLKQDASEGKFRPDLYYRMGGFTIHLPPLRERGDDLYALARYYLSRCSRELGREVHEISPEAIKALHRYTWPGNVRELKSVLKQALLRAHGTVLVPSFLPPLQAATAGAPCPVDNDVGEGLDRLLGQPHAAEQTDLYAQAHRQLDRLLLARVLDEARGNQHQAARRLGIARETLRRRLRELGLHVTRRTHLLEPA